MDQCFVPVQFVGGTAQVERPARGLVLPFSPISNARLTSHRGRTEEQKARSREYSRRHKAKQKAELAKDLPGADQLDFRTSKGRQFKEAHGFQVLPVKKKPKKTETLPGPSSGDATALFLIERPQSMEFHYFEPPSMLRTPDPPTLDPLTGQPSPKASVLFETDANAAWPSPSESGIAGPSTAVMPTHRGSSPPNRFSPPHCSPLPRIYSPRPATPLVLFTPPPPSPVHHVRSLVPPSLSPITPPMPSMENTQALNTWEDSPLSALPSLPGTPTAFSADAEPSAGGLTVVDPDTTDFAAAVIGIELSPETPSLEWPTGFKTAVPFIPDPKNPKKNKLALVRTLIAY